MDVVRVHRGHLAALNLTDPPLGVQHVDSRPLLAAHRLDRRRSGIAGGRADDGHARIAGFQNHLEKLAQQLQRHVLEGQGRTMEQLHQPEVGVELLQGRDGAMGKA